MPTTTTPTTPAAETEEKECRCCGCTRYPHLGCAALAARDAGYMQAAIAEQGWRMK